MSGGPRCARGVNLSAPTSTKSCMPNPPIAGDVCQLRKEYTDAERATWQAWREHRMEAMAKIMVLIPGSSRDRKKRDHWGKTGAFGCPACDWGVVHWGRASVNGHMRAVCTTPGCFSVIE
jgi:hypothetical protein